MSYPKQRHHIKRVPAGLSLSRWILSFLHAESKKTGVSMAQIVERSLIEKYKIKPQQFEAITNKGESNE
jgi:hypothetical protein